MTCNLCDKTIDVTNGDGICTTCCSSTGSNGSYVVHYITAPDATRLYAEIGQLRRANRNLRAVIVSTWIAALAVACAAVWVLTMWSDGGQ